MSTLVIDPFQIFGVEAANVYDPLTQITYIFDDVGLVNNTDNLYGVVDGSGNVEKWKSIAPGLVNDDYTFVQSVTANPLPTLDSGIKFVSNQKLESKDISFDDQWLFLNINAVPNDLKWTLTFVLRFTDLAASLTVPFSNANLSASTKIFWTYVDDRSGRNNALQFNMRGADNQEIVRGTILNFYTETIDQVITISYDHSLASNNLKAYNGNSLIGTLNKVDNPTDSSSSRIMGLSNAAFQPPTDMHLRTIVAQQVVESDSVRNSFINNLKTKYGIS